MRIVNVAEGGGILSLVVFVLITLISGYTPFRWLALCCLYIEAAFQQVAPAVHAYGSGYKRRVIDLRADVAIKPERLRRVAGE